MPIPKLVLPSAFCRVGWPPHIFDTPAVCAVAATLLGPTWLANRSNVVLSEYFIAFAMVTWPLYGRSDGSLLIWVPSIVTVKLPLTIELIASCGCLPCRLSVRTVARVNGLDGEAGRAQRH